MFRKLVLFAITSGLAKKIFNRYWGRPGTSAKVRPGKPSKATSPWSSGPQA